MIGNNMSVMMNEDIKIASMSDKSFFFEKHLVNQKINYKFASSNRLGH